MQKEKREEKESYSMIRIAVPPSSRTIASLKSIPSAFKEKEKLKLKDIDVKSFMMGVLIGIGILFVTKMILRSKENGEV